MITNSIYFKGYGCFKSDWTGFETIKPVNVIIGRNNTGKSHLLNLVEAICSAAHNGKGWRCQCNGVLDEDTLKMIFRENAGGGDLNGDHWRDHGRHLLNIPIQWEIDENGNPTNERLGEEYTVKVHDEHATKQRLKRIAIVLKRPSHQLCGSLFRRLLADRDIRPETPGVQLTLGPDGHGASNIIRRYIVTSNPQLPREIIQRDLLGALNKIFGSDGQFTEIQVKIHDEAGPGKSEGHWEVFFGESKKGLIPLSNSGSGLKTVLLVLLNLLVVPEIEKKAKSKFTFAFEELENNLHPALLRRLLQYLEDYAVNEKATVFLTTHSSTALDLFGLSKNAQIVHVTHDGEAARVATVSAHFDHLGVISELGAKPSDLLQANGIIWVEGPSDCIYLNRWLNLYTRGRLQEGRDYQCAFYGGSLLARTQFSSPESAEKDLVNLFRINPNVVVVCDGDRTAIGARVKDRVRRIRAEVMKIPGAHIWITEAREIENYVPGAILAMAIGVAGLPDPNKYEMFFPRKGSPGNSYVETRMNRKGIDKMELAVLSVSQMDLPMMRGRFDWEVHMKQIVERIDSWNR